MREEEESLQRGREEREAQLVENERLMRERQERKERAKADRSVEQIIRDKEYQRHYYQNHVNKLIECERCKRIYASVYSMRRHNCCVPIECERCKRLYASVYSMRRHYCCVRGKV